MTEPRVEQPEQPLASRTISVVVLTYNEAHRLRPCLESVSWANEIVVVDGFSTDSTVEIAREYTPNVYLSDLLGPSNPGGYSAQRNFAIEKATGDWIFFLDADERVPSDLAREIEARLLRTDEGHAAYRIRRTEHFFGVPTPYTHGDGCLIRIMRRGLGRFDGRLVHEGLQFDGSLGDLNEPFEHFSKDTVVEYVATMNRYTSLEADILAKEGRPLRSSPVRDMSHAFFYRYIYLRGYREGVFGLLMCLMFSFYAYLTWAKHWEHAKNQGLVPGQSRPSAGIAAICSMIGAAWRSLSSLKRLVRGRDH